VQPVHKPHLKTGVVRSQGDSAQRSGIARQITGLDGEGVKIGVLSDSYNNLNGAAAGILAGELPGITNPNGYKTPVKILTDLDSSGSDEGRGMLEIVHDVAPASSLYFRTAFISESDFANGIIALADSGCKVIIDDVGYFAEPYFQDGIIAQAVDQVRTAKGVAYFSSAGNSGFKSYENVYLHTNVTLSNSPLDTVHNFGTVGSPRYLLPITIPIGASVLIGFQWDDPFFSVSGGSGALSDMDIRLVRTSNNTAVAGSAVENLGGDPFEIFGYTNNTTGTAFSLLITKYGSGNRPGRLKTIDYGSSTFTTTTPAVVGINSGTLVGHPNADGAVGVGAARYDRTPAYGINPPLIESFSSKGGARIIFDTTGNRLMVPLIRQKPEVTAPDGGNTSFFGGGDYEGDGKPNFFGTSASAPHVGAVAALMLQANPALTPVQVKTTLINSCVDMNDTATVGFDVGFDFATGYGLIRADSALLALQPIYATLAGRNLCAGNITTVNYASKGVFNAGNVFTAQLSDSLGSFAVPVNIGTLASTAKQGSISATIPANAKEGTLYRIRVVSSNGANTGVSTYKALSVALPNLNLVGTATSGLKRAGQSLTSTQTIPAATNAVYQAGQSVVLNPTFATTNGSVFSVEIKGCTN
jgi:subtilisin family serine protease